MATAAKKKKSKKVSRPVPVKAPAVILVLGTYLRELREKKKLTMKEVAESMGYSTYQFIYNMEKEKCMPPPKQIKKISEIYGVADKEIRMAVVKHLIGKVKKKYGFKQDAS